jgi:hypothetical protein
MKLEGEEEEFRYTAYSWNVENNERGKNEQTGCIKN